MYHMYAQPAVDAAYALLSLQRNNNLDKSSNRTCNEDTATAAIILSNIISRRGMTGSSVCQMRTQEHPLHNKINKNFKRNVSQTYEERSMPKRNASTQTEDSGIFDLEDKQKKLNMLTAKICSLEAELQNLKNKLQTPKAKNSNNDYCKSSSGRRNKNNSLRNSYTSFESKNSNTSDMDLDEDDSNSTIDEENHSAKVIHNENLKERGNELVPIGYGNALVSMRILRGVNWRSYTSATRKLLTTIFSRRVLATHSLTGKRSPAFPNKPAKTPLNPVLVNDIVKEVVDRCHVPENVVRTIITTKCADESKMFKTRLENQMKTRKRKSKGNIENIPPYYDDDSSDASE